METIFELSDILGIIICVLPALLTAIAIIRIVIKTRRGGHIDVPPVGVMNDLPSSVTGINKHDDMRERATERANRRLIDRFCINFVLKTSSLKGKR